MKKYHVAIVGASGVVGQKFLEVLAEYQFPIEKLYLFASHRSAGKEVVYEGQTIIIEELTPEVFTKYPIQIALFSAGGETSQKYAPVAAQAGVVVIDNSSAWRMDENIPLVVPEVNANVLTGEEKIIANPNCSTIQSVVALKPVDDLFGIKAVNYATYQAVSGSGVAGIRDLESGIKGEEHTNYPHPIAFNVLPHIDQFLDNGYTKEEVKMVNETKKIMGLVNAKITATCVRVPVWNGHSVAMSITCEKPIDLHVLRDAFETAPGVVLADSVSRNEYPMPLMADGTDDTFVGRLRVDLDDPHTLHLFCAADNIRKGAASNTIQIAQYLIANNLV